MWKKSVIKLTWRHSCYVSISDLNDWSVCYAFWNKNTEWWQCRPTDMTENDHSVSQASCYIEVRGGNYTSSFFGPLGKVACQNKVSRFNIQYPLPYSLDHSTPIRFWNSGYGPDTFSNRCVKVMYWYHCPVVFISSIKLPTSTEWCLLRGWMSDIFKITFIKYFSFG